MEAVEAVEAIDQAEASPRPGTEDFEDSVSTPVVKTCQDMIRKEGFPPRGIH